MLQDIAYSVLKENKRAYEILLLRDQYGNTFADIAREYGISHMWARELYSRIKTRQIRLYIARIAIALGFKNGFDSRCLRMIIFAGASIASSPPLRRKHQVRA